MKRETAELIKAAADEGGREVEVRDGYSGRGMYGKATCSVVGSRTDIQVSVLWAAYNLGVETASDPNDCPDFAEAMEDLEGLRWDQMGRDDEVCY